MKFLENMFGGPKDMSAELEQTGLEEAVQEEPTPKEEVVVPERKKKTIEEVKQAMGELQKLQIDRWEKLEKHRNTIEELREMGVNEYNPDTAPRTETVNDILNPIEDELVAISREISEKRKEFDLQPDREQVIERRRYRLGELERREIEGFNKTQSGKQVRYIDAQIKQYEQNSKIYGDEIKQLQEERKNFFDEDKVAHMHLQTMDRIKGMEGELRDMLKKSRTVGYDDNGIKSR